MASLIVKSRVMLRASLAFRVTAGVSLVLVRRVKARGRRSKGQVVASCPVEACFPRAWTMRVLSGERAACRLGMEDAPLQWNMVDISKLIGA